jgi:tetratricopeptide (TPR) repeat protein
MDRHSSRSILDFSFSIFRSMIFYGMRARNSIGFFGRSRQGAFLFQAVVCGMLIGVCAAAWGEYARAPEIFAGKLYRLGRKIAEQTHYLEALDPLDEAKDILEKDNLTDSRLYADVIQACAQIKVKGRLHQNFPAYYVKSALKEIQRANRIRERLPSPVPQQLADGYFLEGFIQKRFFRRMNEARKLFETAINVYPGHVPAKRHLSELQ